MGERGPQRGERVLEVMAEIERRWPLERSAARDIAELFGISRQRVYQLISQVEEQLHTSRPKPSHSIEPVPDHNTPTRPVQKDPSLSHAETQPTRRAINDVVLQEDDGMKIHAWVAKNRMAFATVQPSKMDDLFFISRYTDSDPDSPAPRKHGYQREPMTTRLAGIASYFLADENEYQITPIIVSVRLSDADDIAEFENLFNSGKSEQIHRRWHKGTVSVVDGQHRYLGLVRARQDAAKRGDAFDPAVPVMLYFGLSYEDEAEMFNIINSTQRKLPTALIETTTGDIIARDSDDPKQIIREIGFGLARDKDSVFFDQDKNDTTINMTGARDPNRDITYEGLRRSTANMFPEKLITRLKNQGLNPLDVAKHYWRCVAEACQPAWDKQPEPVWDEETQSHIEKVPDYRIKDLVGIASLAKLGNDVITSALESKEFDDRLAELTSKLSEVDWRKSDRNPWMRSQAGFAGQKELYSVLYDLVYNDIRPGEPA